MTAKFKTYEIAKYNPLEDYPGKKIAALADPEGVYVLYVHLENGLGLYSTDKFILLDAISLVFQYQDELGYSNDKVLLDIPDHVLEKPHIFNVKLKKIMQQRGWYWKKR